MRFFAIVSFLVILPSSFVLAGQMESINVVLLNKIQPYEKRVSYSQTGFSKSRRADFPKTEYVKIWQELMGSFRYDCYIHPKPIQYLMVETDETVPDTVGSMTFAYDPTYGYTGFTIVEDGYSAEAVITYNQNVKFQKFLLSH